VGNTLEDLIFILKSFDSFWLPSRPPYNQSIDTFLLVESEISATMVGASRPRWLGKVLLTQHVRRYGDVFMYNTLGYFTVSLISRPHGLEE